MILVKDLKEKIMSLDDNMKVGSTGHFGEFLECENVEVRNCEGENILCITIEYAGEEPD